MTIIQRILGRFGYVPAPTIDHPDLPANATPAPPIELDRARAIVRDEFLRSRAAGDREWPTVDLAAWHRNLPSRAGLTRYLASDQEDSP